MVGLYLFHSTREGRSSEAHSPCHMETTSVQEEKMQENYGVREFLGLFSVLFPALWVSLSSSFDLSPPLVFF